MSNTPTPPPAASDGDRQLALAVVQSFEKKRPYIDEGASFIATHTREAVSQAVGAEKARLARAVLAELDEVEKYVQAVKNGVPIRIVCGVVKACELLGHPKYAGTVISEQSIESEKMKCGRCGEMFARKDGTDYCGHFHCFSCKRVEDDIDNNCQ